MIFTSCSTTESISQFGEKYAGVYIISQEGQNHLTKVLDSELIEGAKIIIDRSGTLKFSKSDGSALTSGLKVLNNGFFGFMAAYYIVMEEGSIAGTKGKHFGISLLRGCVSITDISTVKPEGKPDPLYDITKG